MTDIAFAVLLIVVGTVLFIDLYKESGKIYCDSVKVFCLMVSCVATLSLGFICLCISFFR